MKTILKFSAAVTAAALLAGCETTGLSPRESSGVTYPNYIYALQATGPAHPPAAKPVVPIRLAVAQVGEPAPSSALLDKLAAQKALVASVSGLPLPGAVTGFPNDRGEHDYASQINTLCRLAQSVGARYVFLYGGDIDSWRKNNAFSILDLTLVGGTFVPGCRLNLEGKGAGVLIEAATGEPVCFVSAEAKLSAGSPDFLAGGKNTSLQAETRDLLIDKLGDQLIARLIQMNPTNAAGSK